MSPCRTLAIIVALVGASLAGCLASTAGPCEEVSVPPAHGGSTFVYAAQGQAWFPGSYHEPVVDWSRVDGSGGNERLQLSENSTVEIRIAEQPVPRLGSEGEPTSAYQTTYLATDPQRGENLDFKGLWFQEETGQLVESTNRAGQEMDSGFRHSRYFSLETRPGLLTAVEVWGHDLEEGDTWSRTVPEGWPQPVGSHTNMTFEYEVQEVENQGDHCRANVTLDVRQEDPDDPDPIVDLVYTDDAPLPVRFLAEGAYEDEDGPFQMELEQASAGSGAALPDLDPELADTGLPSDHRFQRGFLANADDIFETAWPRAHQAIQDDENAGRWLSDHPDARPSRVKHLVGAEDSEVVDRWRVQWWGGPDDSDLETVVTRYETPVVDPNDPGLRDEVEVRSKEISGVEAPEVASGPALSDLARLHELVYGKSIEVVDCQLSSWKCSLGTHAARDEPKAGETAAGAFWDGTVVDVRDGRVLQETSVAEYLIPDPPPR